MEYKNLKTGAVINIDSKLNGGDWVQVTKKKTSPKKNPKTASGKKTND